MFVRNLPAHATQAALIAHFAQLRCVAIVTAIFIAPFFIQKYLATHRHKKYLATHSNNLPTQYLTTYHSTKYLPTQNICCIISSPQQIRRGQERVAGARSADARLLGHCVRSVCRQRVGRCAAAGGDPAVVAATAAAEQEEGQGRTESGTPAQSSQSPGNRTSVPLAAIAKTRQICGVEYQRDMFTMLSSQTTHSIINCPHAFVLMTAPHPVSDCPIVIHHL